MEHFKLKTITADDHNDVHFCHVCNVHITGQYIYREDKDYAICSFVCLQFCGYDSCLSEEDDYRTPSERFIDSDQEMD